MRLPFVVRRPVDFAARYVLRRGTYPATMQVQTPVGVIDLAVYCHEDVVTVAEVFCRQDYKVGDDIRTVVDVGSNIGVSAAYFLTRNDEARVWCFEPAPQNLPRLREQLAPFGERVLIDDAAIGATDGDICFGVEPTGRYGSAVDIGDDFTRITVRCRAINNVVEQVLAERGTIDVLKLDTEGSEIAAISELQPELLARIGLIVFESARAPALHPDQFSASYSEPVNRLLNRTTVHGP